ncbi:MAG: hypothetical protein ABI591_32170 [Kofleriaceae bacterium]
MTRLALVATFGLLSGLLFATTALADGILVKGDYPKVKLAVGQTVEVAVGYYRGFWGCDDGTLVTADIVTKNDTNYWVVTGAKAGSTQCRVGLEQLGGFTVFDVYVTAPPPKAAAKK